MVLVKKGNRRISMDFIEKRKIIYIISSILIIIGLLAMPFNAFSGNEILNYDIEFKGGTLMHVNIGQDFDIDKDIRPIVVETTGDSAPHITKVVGQDEVIIKVTETTTEQRKDLFDKLKNTYNLEDADQLEVGDVSPTVSGEMKNQAVKAIIISVILMLIYITIRFKDIHMGAGAVFALVHDVLIVFLIYSVFRIPVNNSFIAVMLTILGYSINDTIVIFDRVRENRGSTKLKDKDIINTSINQSLSRTINTSITTLSVVLLLFIFGTSAVREFALPLVVGMAVGTYSSIFLAGPLWYDINRIAKNRKKKAV